MFSSLVIQMIILTLLLGPAKVYKVKIFSGPYYIIQRIQTLVLGALEPVYS